VSEGNFRGGRKPSPKPSAFESEIHPPHKPSVYAPGISPLQGADSRRFELFQTSLLMNTIAQSTGTMSISVLGHYHCWQELTCRLVKPSRWLAKPTTAGIISNF